MKIFKCLILFFLCLLNFACLKKENIEYMHVPSQWQMLNFPSQGYAKYGLKILLPESFKNKDKFIEPSKKIPLSISMTDTGTAYEILVY